MVEISDRSTHRNVLDQSAFGPTTVAVASFGSSTTGSDPIFAAIEAHLHAEEQFLAALQDLSKLERELPEQRRQSEFTGGNLTVAPEDDPRWIAIQETIMVASKFADETATRLLTIQPTTLAGVGAALRHAYNCGRRGLEFPSGFDDGDLIQSPCGADWVVYFHRNLAQAIEAIDRSSP